MELDTISVSQTFVIAKPYLPRMSVAVYVVWLAKNDALKTCHCHGPCDGAGVAP